jgi:integrase
MSLRIYLAPRLERGCPRTTSGENVSTITPHTLRRTFGVSKLFGHSSTVVTERAYAELLGSTVREELLAVFTTAA